MGHLCLFYILTTVMMIMIIIRENLDYEASQLVPGLVQDVIYLTAVLNSCINPVIYGMYYYR